MLLMGKGWGVMSGSNKAEGYRRLVQNDGPPGCLEESDPAGCDFVRDGRSILPALTDNIARPAVGLLSCERLAILVFSTIPGGGMLLQACIVMCLFIGIFQKEVTIRR